MFTPFFLKNCKKRTMTILEFILTAIIWIAYGCFNAYQYDWYEEDGKDQPLLIFFNILLAPIALAIRIIRGVFFWKGD